MFRCVVGVVDAVGDVGGECGVGDVVGVGGVHGLCVYLVRVFVFT